MNAIDLTTSAGRVAGLIATAAAPVFAARSRRRRGHDHDEGLGYWERLGRTQGDTSDSTIGTTPTQGHQRAQTAVERPNSATNLLRRAIARRTGQQMGEIRAWGFAQLEWRL
jgi:hypothetical protein